MRMRWRFFRVVGRVTVERNHGANAFDTAVAVERQGVMVPVADEDVDIQGQVVFLDDLAEFVQGLRASVKSDSLPVPMMVISGMSRPLTWAEMVYDSSPNTQPREG